jgi:trafficking protein particle complex subunit 13
MWVSTSASSSSSSSARNTDAGPCEPVHDLSLFYCIICIVLLLLLQVKPSPPTWELSTYPKTCQYATSQWQLSFRLPVNATEFRLVLMREYPLFCHAIYYTCTSTISSTVIADHRTIPHSSCVSVCSTFSGNAGGGVEVAPEQGIDTIVSYKLEEPGSHILRVEVGYATMDGTVKTFRKFYRFQVTDPLVISHQVLRADEGSCLVAVSVQYSAPTDKASSNNSLLSATSGLVLSVADFVPAEGLQVQRMGGPSPTPSFDDTQPPLSALQLLDECGRLEPGNTLQYLFKISTQSRNAEIRGIAAGDHLGQAVFTWSKTMGETGRIVSPTITCPESLVVTQLRQPLEDPTTTTTSTNDADVACVQNSGLSVDVAASAAQRAVHGGVLPTQTQSLDQLLPVTVEPIQPPTRMTLATPQQVQFLVMNHSPYPLSLQLQFRLEQQIAEGLVICGRSFKTLGEVGPQGGCTVVTMRITALATGLLRLHGCYVVDLTTDKEIPQPPLLDILVDQLKTNQSTMPNQHGGMEIAV